jgi:hypothetical protein
MAVTSPGGSTYVLWASRFELKQNASLRVIGSRPLIVASNTSISVAGSIDAGSHLISNVYYTGPGAELTPCANGATAGASTQDKGAGGGGGGFGAKGGDGGHPDGLNAGSGGAAITLPELVRAGCAGARGGGGNNNLGGPGGGGLVLTARESITISGNISASGAGGRGAKGNKSYGGGGGGSGGMIAIDAPTIMISGYVTANGGGGGGGGDGGPGQDGQDGLMGATTAALGGSGGSDAQDGGNGGNVGDPPGESLGDTEKGGGGGGGGVGFVRVHGTAQISPGTTSPLHVLD